MTATTRKTQTTDTVKWTPTRQDMLTRAERWLKMTKHCPLLARLPVHTSNPRCVVGFGVAGHSIGVIVIEPWAVQKDVLKASQQIIKSGIGGEWFMMIAEFCEYKTALAIADKLNTGIIRLYGSDFIKVNTERSSGQFQRNHKAEIMAITKTVCGTQRVNKKK